MKAGVATLAVGTFFAAQAATAKDFLADCPHVTHSTYVEPSGDRAIRLAMDVPAKRQQCLDAFATIERFRGWAVHP